MNNNSFLEVAKLAKKEAIQVAKTSRLYRSKRVVKNKINLHFLDIIKSKYEDVFYYKVRHEQAFGLVEIQCITRQEFNVFLKQEYNDSWYNLFHSI